MLLRRFSSWCQKQDAIPTARQQNTNTKLRIVSNTSMKVVTSSIHNHTSDDKTPTYNNGSPKHSQWTFYLWNDLEADTKDKTPRQVDVKSVQIRSEKRHQFLIYIRTDKCRYCCRQKDNEHEGLAGACKTLGTNTPRQ
ncbi:uncharacterized protein LOC143918723 [Arctopsyche grandis]|uniref:uncharacterized protein LOC143918723 n=1 Tax=Arctopsyche grandis TaxID=121162 RepID=UPI00406D711C